MVYSPIRLPGCFAVIRLCAQVLLYRKATDESVTRQEENDRIT